MSQIQYILFGNQDLSKSSHYYIFQPRLCCWKKILLVITIYVNISEASKGHHYSRLQSIRYVVYRLVVEERTSISKWFYVQFTVVGVSQINVKITVKVLLGLYKTGRVEQAGRKEKA